MAMPSAATFAQWSTCWECTMAFTDSVRHEGFLPYFLLAVFAAYKIVNMSFGGCLRIKDIF